MNYPQYLQVKRHEGDGWFWWTVAIVHGAEELGFITRLLNAAGFETKELRSMTYRIYLPSEAGPDGYPLAWHQAIKHAVREEAGHRCVRCRHPYRGGEHGRGEWSPCDEQCRHQGPFRWRVEDAGEWHFEPDPKEMPGVMCGSARGTVNSGHEVEAQWRILTVHHLDEVKLNCRWWNLAALCQRCHLTIQGRVKLHRPYFLEHSEWFRPYVAGYYALRFLGEELDRAAVLARLDELLALATMKRQPQILTGEIA